MEFFAGKVGRIRAKILHIPKNLPDPTPMNSSTVSNKIRTNIISITLDSCNSRRFEILEKISRVLKH